MKKHDLNQTSSSSNKPQSLLEIKDERGNYVCYVGTDSSMPIEDLEYNGDDLCQASRYEEAIECYVNALAKRPITDYDRWNSLVNLSVPLTNLGRHEEALTVLREALQGLITQKREDLYGWVVEARMKFIQEKMYPIAISPVVSSTSSMSSVYATGSSAIYSSASSTGSSRSSIQLPPASLSAATVSGRGAVQPAAPSMSSSTISGRSVVQSATSPVSSSTSSRSSVYATGSSAMYSASNGSLAQRRSASRQSGSSSSSTSVPPPVSNGR